MSAGRCSKCHREGAPCWWCQRRCARKKRYASYEQARDVRDLMRQRDNDPVLDVYRCNLGEHWHIGHATGMRAKVLRKRVEKLRRKALIRARQAS